MTELRIGSLFSGAGGLDLAVQQVFGGEVVWHAEIDKAASKVLAHRFPGVPNLGDISAVDWADVPEVDVLCGGFPCQDVSAAGKRAGIKDGTRSGLWSVFAEAIDALRPQWVVVENVRGLLSATAHRTEVDDDERNCICGWLDRWRGLHRLGRQSEAWEGADIPGASDGGNDDACHRRAEVAERSVGRISAQLSEGYGHLGVRVDVDGSGGRRTSTAATGCALLESQIGSSAAGFGGGADQSGSSSAGEWYGSGMELARACRVRGDQDENAFPERQGAKCQSCGGFLPSDTTDSDLESSKTPLGNGGDGSLLRAAGAVCGTLSDLGYDAQWTTIAAADVGAPHRRERVFILATDTSISPGVGLQQQDLSALQQRWGDRRPGQSGVCDCGDSACVADVADSSRYGRHKGPESAGIVGGFDAAVSGDEPGVALLPTPTQSDGTGGGIRTGLSWEGTTKSTGDGGNSRLRDVAGLLGPLLPTPRSSDCFGAGQHGDGGMDLRTTISLLPTPNAVDGHPRGGARHSTKKHPTLNGEARLVSTNWGKYEPAICRWEAIVGPAPAPTEPNKNGNPRLSAAFSEWLMGWPAGWVTDPAIGISRNDQLRIVGNGVVSRCAEAAIRYLLAVSNDD